MKTQHGFEDDDSLKRAAERVLELLRSHQDGRSKYPNVREFFNIPVTMSDEDLEKLYPNLR